MFINKEKTNKKNSNIKNFIKRYVIIIVSTLAVIGVVAGLYYLPDHPKEEPVIEDPTITAKDILEQISLEDINYIREYDENAVLSSWFKGIIKFDSGLIDMPVVQSIDNDFYLRRDWKTNSYSELGSIFMDYECALDSKNIIIYGHNVVSYYDAGVDENGEKLNNDELMFTPLKFLTDEENYEENKTVRLILEDEVRVYEIASVFYCNLEGEGSNLYPEEYLEYFLTEYDDAYFAKYKNKIKDIEFYDTGVEFTNEDNLLTLQTCIEGNDYAREIVLCKQVDTIKPDRKTYKKYKTLIEKLDIH